MSVRRPASAITLTFLLLAGFFVLSAPYAQDGAPMPGGLPTTPPLAGSNSVSGLSIAQAKSGVWMADFDYFFTGDPYSASLAVELTPQPGAPLGPNGTEQYQTFLQQPRRGAHHVSVAIRYPGGELRTLKVTVTMRKEMFSPVVVANQSIDKVIDWPDFQTFIRNQQLAMATPEQNL